METSGKLSPNKLTNPSKRHLSIHCHLSSMPSTPIATPNANTADISYRYISEWLRIMLSQPSLEYIKGDWPYCVIGHKGSEAKLARWNYRPGTYREGQCLDKVSLALVNNYLLFLTEEKLETAIIYYTTFTNINIFSTLPMCFFLLLLFFLYKI